MSMVETARQPPHHSELEVEGVSNRFLFLLVFVVGMASLGGRWRRPSRSSSATRSRTRTRLCSAAGGGRPATRAPELQTIARVEAARLGLPLPGGEVYSDDRAPVEWLIDRSILGYAAGD